MTVNIIFNLMLEDVGQIFNTNVGYECILLYLIRRSPMEGAGAPQHLIKSWGLFRSLGWKGVFSLLLIAFYPYIYATRVIRIKYDTVEAGACPRCNVFIPKLDTYGCPSRCGIEMRTLTWAAGERKWAVDLFSE